MAVILPFNGSIDKPETAADTSLPGAASTPIYPPFAMFLSLWAKFPFPEFSVVLTENERGSTCFTLKATWKGGRRGGKGEKDCEKNVPFASRYSPSLSFHSVKRWRFGQKKLCGKLSGGRPLRYRERERRRRIMGK